MVATVRGVYHNLLESNYAVSLNDTALFFSSELYLKKFLSTYEEKRLKKLSLLEKQTGVNCCFLSVYIDVVTYSEIEKRGYLVNIAGVDYDWLKVEDVFQELIKQEIKPRGSLNWQKVKYLTVQDIKQKREMKTPV